VPLCALDAERARSRPCARRRTPIRLRPRTLPSQGSDRRFESGTGYMTRSRDACFLCRPELLGADLLALRATSTIVVVRVVPSTWQWSSTFRKRRFVQCRDPRRGRGVVCRCKLTTRSRPNLVVAGRTAKRPRARSRSLVRASRSSLAATRGEDDERAVSGASPTERRSGWSRTAVVATLPRAGRGGHVRPTFLLGHARRVTDRHGVALSS